MPRLSRLLLAVVAALLTAAAAEAADGDLDPIFGAGVFRFDAWTPSESRCALLHQPDGALVVAGYDQNASRLFLGRLDAGGAPDSSFGADGVVEVDASVSPEVGVDLALQPDGKIVLAVAHQYGVNEAFVARFLADGTPDASFGTLGVASSGLHGPHDGSVAVAVSQGGQGDVYLAARDQMVSLVGIGVVRFNSAGELDGAFGGSGVADPGYISSPYCGIDLDLESGVLLASYDNTVGESCVTRFAWDGFPDPTFGPDATGTVHLGVGSALYADVGLAVLPGGRILFAGYDPGAGRDYVFRLQPDGNADLSFGSNGYAAAAVPGTGTSGLDVLSLTDGRAALAGIHDAVPCLTYLAVFDSSGAPDPGYGTGGVLSVPIWRGDDTDVVLTAQPDGALVVAGTDDPVEKLFVTRFVDPGVRDETFAPGGIVRSDLPGFFGSGRSLALQGNGGILLAGWRGNCGCGYVMRFHPTGWRDPGFGPIGFVDISDFGVDAHSAIPVVTEPVVHRKYVGVFHSIEAQHAVFRVHASGTRDYDYGDLGITYTGIYTATTSTLDLALSPDRKLLAAGNGWLPEVRLQVARLDTLGALDPTFAGGVVTLPWSTFTMSQAAVRSIPGGDVYVAGVDSTLGELCLAHLDPWGVLDPVFGSGGLAHTGVPGTNAVDLAVGSGLLLAGVDAGASRAFVARFDWDGVLDPTFGTSGTGIAYVDLDVSSTAPIALAVEPNGWIYVAGLAGLEHFVARFTPEGVLDSAFGTAGVATTGESAVEGTVVDLALQGDGYVVLAGYGANPGGDLLARFVASPYSGTSAPNREERGRLVLAPCFPNPFRHSTSARFSLPEAARARATIHDVQGRLVTTLLEGIRPAGSHLVRWTGRDRGGCEAAAGIYFLRLECEDGVRAQKLVRVRN